MLNTPNEWHNEEDTEEYYDDEYASEDEYEDGEYAEDEEIGDDGGSNGGNKKIIFIIVGIIILVLLVVGGILGIKAVKNKNSTQQNMPVVEAPADETQYNQEGEGGNPEGEFNEGNTSDEVSIDVEGAENNNEEGLAGEETNSNNEGEQQANNENQGENNPEQGLEVPENESPVPNAQNTNDTVTISIGDVGRKNPFRPSNEVSSNEKVSYSDANGLVIDVNDDVVNFDVIEPPALSPASANMAKLLQTKVTGILYDSQRPSAIINIDGLDQLVRVGDNLGGFEIVSITKNKVVIRDGNNVYRASVGQPLNAEKLANPVEISNLETKFAGSTKN